MPDDSILTRGVRKQAVLIGLVVGINVSLPMYLWQSDPRVALASLVIAGYTAWLWAATRQDATEGCISRSVLRTIPINSINRRVVRMIGDLGFWWSLGFGSATVTGSVWYAGLQDPIVLAGIGAAWSMTAVAMNYELSLFKPSTRCRKCQYQLMGHLNPNEAHQSVRCPECGSIWSKEQLCLTQPPMRLSG